MITSDISILTEIVSKKRFFVNLEKIIDLLLDENVVVINKINPHPTNNLDPKSNWPLKKKNINKICGK